MILTCANCNHAILGYRISKERDLAACHACGHEFSIQQPVAVPGLTHAVYVSDRPLRWRIEQDGQRTRVDLNDDTSLAVVGAALLIAAVTIVVFACFSLSSLQEFVALLHLALVVWWALRASFNRACITIDADTVTIEEQGPVWPRAPMVRLPTREIERFFAEEPASEERDHRLTYVTTNGARIILSRPELPADVDDATFAAARLTELLRKHQAPTEHFVLRW